MGPNWEIENILAGNHEVIPPRYSNQHVEFPQGTTGIWKQKLAMSVPPEANDKDQVQYEDIIKVFLTVQSTSSMSLELPELGKSAAWQGTSREGRRQRSFFGALGCIEFSYPDEHQVNDRDFCNFSGPGM